MTVFMIEEVLTVIDGNYSDHCYSWYFVQYSVDDYSVADD